MEKNCDLKFLNQESVAEHSFSLMSLALFYLDKAKYPYKDDVMNLALLHDLIKGIYNKDINRKSSNYLKQKRNEKCTLLYLSLIGTYDNHVNLFEYFNIVYSYWDNDVSDTIRIFNDLEIIQRLIKMNYYISNKAKIKEEKINDFKKDLKMLETNFGRDLAKKFNL